MDSNQKLKDAMIYPDEQVFKTILGKGFIPYCELLKLLDKNDISHDWIYYNDVKAWLCKASQKKRTIIWISAWTGFVKATIYFPEKYINGIYDLNISEEMKSKIRAMKNTGKSKGCVFEIKGTEVLNDFNIVMQYKISNK